MWFRDLVGGPVTSEVLAVAVRWSPADRCRARLGLVGSPRGIGPGALSVSMSVLRADHCMAAEIAGVLVNEAG